MPVRSRSLTLALLGLDGLALDASIRWAEHSRQGAKGLHVQNCRLNSTHFFTVAETNAEETLLVLDENFGCRHPRNSDCSNVHCETYHRLHAIDDSAALLQARPANDHVLDMDGSMSRFFSECSRSVLRMAEV
jgi:hypothetical protein